MKSLHHCVTSPRTRVAGAATTRSRSALSTVLVSALLGSSTLLAGCPDNDEAPANTEASSGGDGGSGGEPGSGGGGASGGGSAVKWGGCPGDFISECATVALPLDPSKPGGATLPVFVSRHLAPGGAAKAQVWLLQGGPGDSGNMFTGFIEQLWERVMPDVDWYVLEHRGVGLSSRLECPVQEDPSSEDGAEISASEWPACIQALKAQWGDDLAHFTTSADADDLARLVERAREHGKKVILYGASYGTARALRFLQKYPEAVDAVILDSIVSPGAQYLSSYDTQFDPVLKDLSAICAADPVCGAKLGPDHRPRPRPSSRRAAMRSAPARGQRWRLASSTMAGRGIRTTSSGPNGRAPPCPSWR